MAESKFQLEQVYVISQRGHDIGININGNIICAIKAQFRLGTINVSPFLQGI